MERKPEITDSEELTSCVADFLARHGVAGEDELDGELADVRTPAVAAETIDETLRQAISEIESDLDDVTETTLVMAPTLDETTEEDENFVPLHRGETNLLTRERLSDLRSVANSISTNVLSRYQYKVCLNHILANLGWSGTAAMSSVALTILAPSIQALTFWMSSVALVLAMYGFGRSWLLLSRLKRARR